MYMVLGLGYLGYELLNYINYKKIVNHSNNKLLHSVSEKDEKSIWMQNYLLNLDTQSLENWITKNIRSNEDITIQNISKTRVLKCLSFNIYFEKYKNIDNDKKANLDFILNEIEDKIAHKFLDIVDNYDYYKFGHNNIVTMYKPVLYYSVLSMVKQYTYNTLYKNGFKKYTMKSSNITYFYYLKDPSFNTTIFIHGLGFGTTPYLNFILELSKTTNLILPILPNISNMEINGIFDKITDDTLFPGYLTIKNDFRELLIFHEINQINLIGHSFGTIMMAIILQDDDFRSKVYNKIFIDPVCFIDESYKIFRYIDNPDDRNSIINKVFNKIVYDDVYVRYATQRFLHGPNFWVFDYKLLEKTIVVLSQNDKIVPTTSIQNTLCDKGIPCILIENAAHGDIFTSEYLSVQELIIDFNKKLKY